MRCVPHYTRVMCRVAPRSAVLRMGLDSLHEETRQTQCHVLTRDSRGLSLVRQVLYRNARSATCNHTHWHVEPRSLWRHPCVRS